MLTISIKNEITISIIGIVSIAWRDIIAIGELNGIKDATFNTMLLLFKPAILIKNDITNIIDIGVKFWLNYSVFETKAPKTANISA